MNNAQLYLSIALPLFTLLVIFIANTGPMEHSAVR